MSNQHPKPRRGRAIAAAVAAACAFAAAALAAEDGRAEAAAKTAQRVVINQVKVSSDGLRVYIDPATGRIKQPTPAEARALDRAIATLPSRGLRNLQATQYSDGTVSLALDEGFLNYALARVNPDGSVSAACVDSAADAEAFLNGSPAPAAEER